MIHLESIQAIDINVFSLVILAIILAALRSKHEKSMIQHKLFQVLIISNMLLIGLEIAGRVFDADSGASGPIAWMLNQFSNLALYIAVPLPAAVWFLYANYQIFHDTYRLRRTALLLLPVLSLNLILSLLSLRTGWFFSIDAANHYHRGPLFPLHVVLSFGILGLACMMVLANRRLLEKRNFRALLLFIVPQVIGTSLQITFYGLSLNWAAMMVAILIVYLHLQDRGLNTDFLTGIYNRRHFEQIIRNRIRRIGEDQSFALILADMDDFKKINDQFGHKAGDEALKKAVHLIQHGLRKDDLVARFGGDEFYVLLELSNASALQSAIKRIYQTFELFNAGSSLPYQLSISMGGTVYDPKNAQSAEEFLRQVDHLMYAEKARRKSILHSGLPEMAAQVRSQAHIKPIQIQSLD